MFRKPYHPKAYLSTKRNIQPGLSMRSRILSFLEREPSDAKTLAQKLQTSYPAVLHHLHLLEAERIVARKGGRPYVWALTGIGQKRLTEIRGGSPQLQVPRPNG